LGAGDLRWAIRSVKDGLPEPLEVAPLASGIVPGSNIGIIGYEPMVTIDLAAFDLAVERGEQFALCLTGGGGAPNRWLSYRGADAPRDRSFELTGLGWRHSPLIPDYSDPPYSAGFSTFIELVPEPSTAFLVSFSVIILVTQRHRCHRPHWYDLLVIIFERSARQ
jgi:hypothetical protein